MAESHTKTENAAAVLKVFSVFETLADEESASLSDIAQKAMTSKTTAHRLMNTLVDLGYAKQDPDTERYSLTLKLFSLAARSLSGRSDLLRIADGVMGKLSRATGESINLGVVDDREQKVTYIHKYDSFYSLSMTSTLGLRNPLHSTSLGKALLAFRDTAEIDDRLKVIDLHPVTEQTITDADGLRAQLALIRAQGFSEEIEESEPGVRCMATPVLDHMGKSVAAISIAFPIFRFDEARRDEYVALLKSAGRDASEALGFKGEIAGAVPGQPIR